MKCFYSQKKKGTAWVDNVQNEKGWTLDFGLQIKNVEKTLQETVSHRILSDRKNPLNVIFFVDSSGSMSGDIDAVKDALFGLLSKLYSYEEILINIGVFSFATSFDEIIQFADIRNYRISYLETQIDNIVAGGGTYLAGALDESINIIAAREEDKEDNIFVLLGDGEISDMGFVQTYYSALDSQNIKVDAIAYDLDETDPNDAGAIANLQEIVNETDGNLYYADQEDISIIYENIFLAEGGYLQLREYSFPEVLGAEGTGFYINDGAYEENISFTEQEIFFQKAKRKVIYDNTSINNYRIACKGDKLSLYGKNSQEKLFSLLSDIKLTSKASPLLNAISYDCIIDNNGILHCVWIDDSVEQKTLYYSYFNEDENTWSDCEKILDNKMNINSPSITYNGNQVFVSFVYDELEYKMVGLIYKNDLGWSLPTKIGVKDSNSYFPQILSTMTNEIVCFWGEGSPENLGLYYAIFNINSLKWSEQRKIKTEGYQVINFDIVSYYDFLYVAYSVKSEENVIWTYISQIRISAQETLKTVKVAPIESGDDFLYDFKPTININLAGYIAIAYVTSTGYTGTDRLSTNIYNLNIELMDSYTEEISISEEGETRCLYPKICSSLSSNIFYVSWIKTNIENDIVALSVLSYNPEDMNFVEEVDSIQLTEDKNIVSFITPPYIQNKISFILQYNKSSEEDLYYPYVEIGSVSYNVEDISSNSLFTDVLNITEKYAKKELRFGDFSSFWNIEYSLYYLRCHLQGAVNPSEIEIINKDYFSSLDSFIISDVIVNNYGNIWAAGPDGLFYYNKNNGKLLKAGTGGEIPFSNINGGIKKIDASQNNELLIMDNFYIYYSRRHFSSYHLLEIPVATDKFYDMAIDNDNNLLIADGNVLKIYDINDIENPTEITTYSLSDSRISEIAIDRTFNIYWIGTLDGLYKIDNKNISTFNIQQGLLSNRINAIAIKDSQKRFIATPVGISVMVGDTFVNSITTDNEILWNNNVKSIIWQEPNILWATTDNKVNQILIDDDEDIVSNVYKLTTKDSNYRIYYIEDVEEIGIDKNTYFEIYINYHRISRGYKIGVDKDGRVCVVFDCNLNPEDIVSVVVRKGVSMIAELDLLNQGDNVTSIKSFDVGVDKEIFMAAMGADNSIQVNDINVNLPYDKIFLDTTPPTGTLELAENEIEDRQTVKMKVSGTDEGSGLDKMIISEYPNFTVDGETSQEPVDYRPVYNYTLNNNMGRIISETIDSGKSIAYDAENNILLYGSENPAIIYVWNWEEQEWNAAFELDVDGIVDFIVFYNTEIFVSVGFENKGAKLYKYTYVISEEDSNVINFNQEKIFSITEGENRLLSHAILNGFLYIGSGLLGIDGPEDYVAHIYKYSNGEFNVLDGDFDSNIFALIPVANEDRLIVGTGNSGKLYSYSVVEQQQLIIYQSKNSQIRSGSLFFINDIPYIFIGENSGGVVKRSLLNKNAFIESFRTIPCDVEKMINVTINDDTKLFAAVGKNLYEIDKDREWKWRYSHSEDILDFTVNSQTGDIYLISEDKITMIYSGEITKNFYLKLIDRAGNESLLYSEDGEIKEEMVTSINISDILKYVNNNKLIEVDENGTTQFSYNNNIGDGFYSGTKIEEEKGVYVSEVLDGMAELVKWNSITWTGEEKTGTEILLYIRSSDNNETINSVSWQGPFDSSRMPLNISYITGRYIQFKIELITTVKDVSPILNSVQIESAISKASHFYTTNFILPSQIKKGIITSEKIIPVSSDIIFGINTTDSVEWNDYQVVDENRLFNINQNGENFRVGIKFLTPNTGWIENVVGGQLLETENVGVVYNSIPFEIKNETAESQTYDIKVSLSEDISETANIFEKYLSEDNTGFMVGGEYFDANQLILSAGESIQGAYIVPATANILCGEVYYANVSYAIGENSEASEGEFELIVEDQEYIMLCNSMFINDINFNFTNEDITNKDFHFRIRFYSDYNRKNLVKTIFSNTSVEDWYIEDSAFSESGETINSEESKQILYDAKNVIDLNEKDVYYLIIDGYDVAEEEYIYPIYTYSFKRIASYNVESGEDIPTVKNFGVMIELDNNEFVKLNI